MSDQNDIREFDELLQKFRQDAYMDEALDDKDLVKAIKYFADEEARKQITKLNGLVDKFKPVPVTLHVTAMFGDTTKKELQLFETFDDATLIAIDLARQFDFLQYEFDDEELVVTFSPPRGDHKFVFEVNSPKMDVVVSVTPAAQRKYEKTTGESLKRQKLK